MGNRRDQLSKIARAEAAERDGFVALLTAFDRHLQRDVRGGLLADTTGDLLRRRVATMIEQVEGGLHLAGALVADRQASRPHSQRREAK